jgi:hypothetical protein
MTDFPPDDFNTRIGYYDCILGLKKAEMAFDEMARMKPHLKTELMKEKTKFLRQMEAELVSWEKAEIAKLRGIKIK